METKDSEAVEQVIKLDPPSYPLNTIAIGGFGMGSIDSNTFKISFLLSRKYILAGEDMLRKLIIGSFEQKLAIKYMVVEEDLLTQNFKIVCIMELDEEEK